MAPKRTSKSGTNYSTIAQKKRQKEASRLRKIREYDRKLSIKSVVGTDKPKRSDLQFEEQAQRTKHAEPRPKKKLDVFTPDLDQHPRLVHTAIWDHFPSGKPITGVADFYYDDGTAPDHGVEVEVRVRPNPLNSKFFDLVVSYEDQDGEKFTYVGGINPQKPYQSTMICRQNNGTGYLALNVYHKEM